MATSNGVNPFYIIIIFMNTHNIWTTWLGLLISALFEVLTSVVTLDSMFLRTAIIKGVFPYCEILQ